MVIFPKAGKFSDPQKTIHVRIDTRENETAAAANAYILRKCDRKNTEAYASRETDCRIPGPSYYTRRRTSLAHLEVARLWVSTAMTATEGVDFLGNGAGRAIRWEPSPQTARTIADRISNTCDAIGLRRVFTCV